MTLDDWLSFAVADADRRGLPELRPLLESLAASTQALRAADWNQDARGGAATAASRPADAPPPDAPH